MSEASRFLAYEATRDLETETQKIETPLESTEVQRIKDNLIVIPILRAGLGMLDGFLDALPFASVGHVGIYRDKLMNHTVEYYFKLPQEHKGSKVLLIDPLLATGDTALATIDRLKEYEVGSIRFVTLLSCKVGLEKLQERHPDVEVYTASIERELNDSGYLLPGLGDAGDRLFNTKPIEDMK
jgi:uracil phosphoribosyltransferase